jgi:hypothetical protein
VSDYSQFFFHFDTISQGFNHLVIEIILSEIDTLKFVVGFELLEDLTHAIHILDCVIFKG